MLSRLSASTARPAESPLITRICRSGSRRIRTPGPEVFFTSTPARSLPPGETAEPSTPSPSATAPAKRLNSSADALRSTSLNTGAQTSLTVGTPSRSAPHDAGQLSDVIGHFGSGTCRPMTSGAASLPTSASAICLARRSGSVAETGQPLGPEPDLVEGHGAPVAGRGLALEADLVACRVVAEDEHPDHLPGLAVERGVVRVGPVDARDPEPDRPARHDEGVRVVGDAPADDGYDHGLARRRELAAQLGPAPLVEPEQEHARVEGRCEVHSDPSTELEVAIGRHAEH